MRRRRVFSSAEPARIPHIVRDRGYSRNAFDVQHVVCPAIAGRLRCVVGVRERWLVKEARLSAPASIPPDPASWSRMSTGRTCEDLCLFW